jgi:hypothetical protein
VRNRVTLRSEPVDLFSYGLVSATAGPPGLPWRRERSWGGSFATAPAHRAAAVFSSSSLNRGERRGLLRLRPATQPSSRARSSGR